MKTLKDILINESNTSTNLEDLNYVMTFANFRSWINEQHKGAKFVTVGIIDDMDLQDLDKDGFSNTYYSKEEKIWVGNINGDEIPVTEWKLRDNDIILIWEI